MKQFAHLITQLDQTNKTLKKVAALKTYFDQASENDKLWTIAILSHKRPKRTVKTTELKLWASEIAEIPLWLFEETYHIVGDLAETLAKVHPNLNSTSDDSLTDWIEYIKNFSDLEEEAKKEAVLKAWNTLDPTERFIFNKLITGGWRIGLSQKLMTRALAQHTGIEENILSHRLMGKWSPDTTNYHQLIIEPDPLEQVSQPYPFYLANAVDGKPEDLGAVENWQAEYKWDGIRGQLIKRKGEVFIWSRGEELVTDKFPELAELANHLPDGVVIDGEIMGYKDGAPLNFNDLQTRIGRKNVTKAILSKVPVILMAYDLLEHNEIDIREKPLAERRKLLEQLVKNSGSEQLHISEIVAANNWEDLTKARAVSRENQAEGLMLKAKDSKYKVGRKKGDWWKWKVDPLSIDAVLIYAMRGHGQRANLYSDYTFAVWNGDELVSFTKAYSGLTMAEIKAVDKYVKANTIDRFGPVRSVTPKLVFEIGFEGIAESKRHKSGVALRFPRILRWREDKPMEEANTLDDLKELLANYQ